MKPIDLSRARNRFALSSPAPSGALSDATRARVNADFERLVTECGGTTVHGGLYRIARAGDVDLLTAAMEGVFPKYRGRIVVFGYDWLGRCFATDNRRSDGDEPEILMMEPGAGEVMQVPGSVRAFHEVGIDEYADDAFALPFFEEWRAQDSNELELAECVGYRVPLFLGGSDDVDNLERGDLEVYLDICGQVLNETDELPDGQPIGDVHLT